MWVWNGESVWQAGRTCTKLLPPTIFHTLKHWYQYTYLGYNYFLMVPPFFGTKWPFYLKIKKTLLWAVFREALIIAPPFLDMCLDICRVWIYQKQSFDWDIILENVAFSAKKWGFLNTKSWSWIMLGVVMNVLYFVLMVCWNQHMASMEMYIFSVDMVLITCWNICMAWLFWVGMH